MEDDTDHDGRRPQNPARKEKSEGAAGWGRERRIPPSHGP